MLKQKQSKFLHFVIFLVVLLSSVLIVSAVVFNSTANPTSGHNTTQLTNISEKLTATSFNTHLSKVFNEDALDFDRNLRAQYLNGHNDFLNLSFKNVSSKEDAVLNVGARNDEIRGYDINNKKYATHLLYCDSYQRYCIFKINGVPSQRLFSFKDVGDTKRNSFDLDENYKLKINSVEFDFCDNRRFCHLGFEGYHVVSITIERKNE